MIGRDQDAKADQTFSSQSDSPPHHQVNGDQVDTGLRTSGVALLGSEGHSIQKISLSGTRWLTSILALAGINFGVLVLCLTFGAERIELGQTAEILFALVHQDQLGIESAGVLGVILAQVRLPRILLACMVGGALAAVGVGLQALLRNPLAEPYVLGISSGAAFGATLALLLGVEATVLSISALPLWAFVGGLLSILVVYRISVSYRMLSVHTLLLAGVILNAMFSALIMFVISIVDPTRAFQMMMWLMGTLSAPDYSALLILFLYLAAGFLILFWQARPLNVLTLGDESARSLGVDVERTKKWVFVTSALLTGAVVSIAGLIGFVGMVVPHAVRMVLGADHRLLLPASALVGGTFLMLADTVARTAFAPSELPVGVVTALIGGPIFIVLLVRRKAGVAL